MMKIQPMTMSALISAFAACGPSPTTEPSVPTSPPDPVADVTEPPEPVEDVEPLEEETEAQPQTIQAKIMAKSDSKLDGTVMLSPTEKGVKIVVNVSGVEPGKHGVHIHEKADCSAPDAKSAGGHFNPAGHDHALPAKSPRHLGDLGNIEVKQGGTGRLEVVREGANLQEGDEHSFLGRALIVHAKEDDGGQPTGNAGGRIGCAEIRSLTP